MKHVNANEQTIWQPDSPRGMSRRDVNSLFTMAGVSMVTVPLTIKPASAAGEITYMGWAGYEEPGFHGDYIEKHGSSPNFTYWGDMDSGFQKIMQGFIADVTHPCTDKITKWTDGGIAAELDPTRLTHLSEIFPELLDIPGTVIDGKRYMIPLDWGNETIIYRSDLLDPEDQGDNLSYGIFFDDKYRGRLSAYNAGEGMVQMAALYLGMDNIFTLGDGELEEIRSLLRKQVDIVQFYWDSPTEAEQALAAGEIVALYGWNDSFARLREQNLPVVLGVPKEGTRTWVCGLVLHPETANVDAAYDLINAMTSADAGAYMIENWGLGHANHAAFEAVTSDILEAYSLTNPTEFLANGVFFEEMAPDVQQRYIDLFDDVKLGS